MAEKLTRVGLEVESVNYLGAGLEGVVTGKVTQIERHPNSDHLWICMMDYGSGEIVQILTGAQNVHQDDIVPVAVVGSQLPSGMKLKKAKMRGLDSFGMLCSAEELGIDAKLFAAGTAQWYFHPAAGYTDWRRYKKRFWDWMTWCWILT